MRKLCVALMGIMGLWLGSTQAQPDWSRAFPPGRAGLDSMLHFVLETNEKTREDLTECLFPSLDDCKRLFHDPKLGRKVYRYQRQIRRTTTLVLGPRMEGQTQLLMWKATPEELDLYEGEARYFPGGYHELARDFQPDLIFYRFKFVEPGRKLGSAYDIMVYLDGHWRLIHRPWLVLFD